MKFNPEDIVGSIVTNTKNHQFKVVEYLGKPKNSHEYKIQFLDTSNYYITTREKIRRMTPKDEKRLLLEKKIQKKKSLTIRRKKHSKQLEKSQTLSVKSKQNLPILSLDQATKNSGYAIIKNGNIINYGMINQTGDNVHIRISKIVKRVRELIEKYDIKVLVLEDIYLGFNAKTYEVLAGLKFILIHLAIEYGIDYVVIKAVEWKSYHNILSGDSITQKIAGVQRIKDKIGIDVSEDTSDAILQGVFAYTECIKDNFSW